MDQIPDGAGLPPTNPPAALVAYIAGLHDRVVAADDRDNAVWFWGRFERDHTPERRWWRALPLTVGYLGLMIVMALKLPVDLGWWP